MRLRFVVQEGVADPRDDGPLLVPKRTHLPALGAGVLRPELARLLLRCRFEGPREQGPDGRHGDVFHLSEVDVESGAVLAPVLPDDDFSPSLRQLADPLEIFLGQFARRHGASVQPDKMISLGEMLSLAPLSRSASCKVGPALFSGSAGPSL
jgi:hypothetical protein